MIENNKVFCAMPWSSIHFRPNGEFFSCCVAEDESFITDTKTKTIDELYNSEKLKQLRLDLLAGIPRPDVCTHCYSKDAANVRSNRIRSLDTPSDKIKEMIKNTDATGYSNLDNIKFWDVRHSNICNLKCRTCNEDFSSSWAAENENFDKIKLKSMGEENKFEQLYDTVNHIYFAGGEPLLTPEHFEVLTKLIDSGRSKDVELSYTTNLTKLDYNNYNLIDLWKNFKYVTINVSMDGYEEKYNYIRHGVDWEILKANIVQLKEFASVANNIHYGFATTISIFNILTFTDVHRYLWQNNLMKDINNIILDLVMYPKYFAFINILPKYLQLLAIDKITSHLTWLEENHASAITIEKFNSIISYIKNHLEINNQSHEVKMEFIRNVKKIDQRRNESFVDTFPELAEMYQRYLEQFIR